MAQAADGIYQWRWHEKIILGFASAMAWAPLAWVFFMVVFMFLSAVLPRTFPLMAALGAVHVIIFGVMACVFPRLYILPAWGLNLLGFFLSTKQVVISLVDPFDSGGIYALDSAYGRYHSFHWHNACLAGFALFFLIALYRPAVFYFRRMVGRTISWRGSKD